jgi:hypothetical protein
MAVYSEFILTIWLILIIAYFIGGGIFLLRLRITEEEAKQRKRITFLVSFMLISLGLSKLFHFLSVLVTEGHLLFALNQLFLIIALIFIIFSFEKRVTSSTKYILTFSLIITETLYLIFGELSRVYTEYILLSQIFQLTLAINMVVAGFAILIVYLRITFKATGAIYKKSLSIVIGILFLILSFGSFILEDLTPLTPENIAMISFACAIISLPFLIFGFL